MHAERPDLDASVQSESTIFGRKAPRQAVAAVIMNFSHSAGNLFSLGGTGKLKGVDSSEEFFYIVIVATNYLFRANVFASSEVVLRTKKHFLKEAVKKKKKEPSLR